jgi:hypothetical protein
VVAQEQVTEADPPSVAAPFVAVEEELRSVAGYQASRLADMGVSTTRAGVESKSDPK